jgi:cytochrome P450
MSTSGAISAGPPAPPVLGHLAAFNRRRQELLNACLALPGPVLELRLPGRTLVVREPADVHHVLVAGAELYEKSPRATSRRARQTQGTGAFTATRAEHRPRRRLVQPAFRHDRIGPLAEGFEAAADAMLDAWRGRGAVDAGAEAKALARRNMATAIFGVEDDRDVQTVIDGVAVRRRAAERELKGFNPVPPRWPIALRPSHRAADRALDDLIGRLIAGAREQPGRPGVLARLTESHGGRAEAVRGELLGMAVAGSETTARVIAWGWLELARCPEAAEGLREGRPGHARAVVSEILRLHPPTPLIARVAVAEDRLPSGARVAEGTKILLAPYLTHRDPRLWPDPDRFRPERFAEGEPGGSRRYAYYPFGGGSRVCLGQSLAVLQSERTLIRTAARFDLAPGEREGTPQPMSAAPPEGAQVRIAERA